MRRRELLGGLVAAAGAAAGQTPAPGPVKVDAKTDAAIGADPILRSILMEMSRARTLRSLGEAIYYVEISADDADSFSASASLGALYAPTRTRLRPVRVQVRVGGPNFDNTNSIYSEYYSGTRYDSEALPLDNDVLAMRHRLWLAIDRNYKMASEALGRKAAALRGVNVQDPLPDFWSSEGRVVVKEPKRGRIDEEAWKTLVRSLSAVFSAYPEITLSGVDLSISDGMFYVVNSGGTIARVPDRVAMLRIRASLQAPNGMALHDGATVQSLDPATLGPEAGLRKVAEGVAQNLKQLREAPMGTSFTGPVLFAGVSAAQLVGEVFGTHLAASRRPVAEPGRTLPIQVSEFEGRIGSRVLPEWMEMKDDPTLAEYKGQALLGKYEVDLEGVIPTPVTLVEKGVLKSLLTTRQPVRGMTATNGRARLPGAFGVKTARHSNLFVTATKKEPEDGLKARLIEMIKAQGKPFGMLIRKMDFPSSGSMEDLRRVAMRVSRSGAGGRPVSSPILAYRVYADGREELVRGLRFRGLTTRSFRDILAAGEKEYQFDYFENGAPWALMGAGNYVVGCSVVAPALLFEELELEADEEDLPKLPVVAPPGVDGGA